MDIEEGFIVYTYHSLARMTEREITKEMVKSVLSYPDQTGTGYNTRQLAYKKFGSRKIKVVYTREGEKYIIISVIWE